MPSSSVLFDLSGSLVADHCHTFTSQRLYYRASYRREGGRIVWQAAVRVGRKGFEEMGGVTTLSGGSGVIAAVKNAVEAAIDMHAFFDGDGIGAVPPIALAHTTLQRTPEAARR
jgi:hypothetical protein